MAGCMSLAAAGLWLQVACLRGGHVGGLSKQIHVIILMVRVRIHKRWQVFVFGFVAYYVLKCSINMTQARVTEVNGNASRASV